MRVIRKLARDRRGATAILMALALSAIVGFAGLGSEVASWYYTTRSMQSAADSAAESAAAALAAAWVSSGTAQCPTSGNFCQDTARAVAATFNFANGTSSTTVTVNNPPTTTTHLTTCSSPFSSYNCYVEVIISQPQTPLLSAVFMSSGPTIQSRAVAFANTKAADTGCVITLNKTASQALQNSGSGNLTFNNCALCDNSNASDALYVGGSGSISAQAAYVVGNVSGTVSTTDGTYTGMNPALDPYANVASPTGFSGSGTCGYGTGNGQSLNKLFPSNGNFNGPSAITTTATTTIINPTGCSTFTLGSTGNQDLHLTNTQTLILCPGTYVFDQASLVMDGQSTLLAPPTATSNPSLSVACPGNLTGGVTIIFSNSGGGNPGIAKISAGANVTMTAPTSGTYSGIAMFGDRITCNGNGNNNNGCIPQMQGGGTQNITGAIYFPKETVKYAGGASAGGSGCTQLIADQINFTGGSTFSSSCASAGTKTIDLSQGNLVM